MLKAAAAQLATLGYPPPPVVFFSGSCAEGIQAFIANEGERAKRSGLVELVGWPVTLVRKTDPPESLLQALQYVQRVHSITDHGRYRDFVVSSLQLTSRELHVRDEQASRMSRLAFFASRACRYLAGYLSEHAPQLLEGKVIQRLNGFADEGLGGYYAFADMQGDSEEARTRRHSLAGFLSGIVAVHRQLQTQKQPGEAVSPLQGALREFGAVITAVVVEFKDCALQRKQLQTTSDFTALVRTIVQRDAMKPLLTAELPEYEIPVFGLTFDQFVGIVTQPVENAVKFNDITRGPVRVSVEAAPLDALEERLQTELQTKFPGLGKQELLAHLCVTDQGPGIADSLLDQIFEEGFSCNPSGEARSTGWGLGVLSKSVRSINGAWLVRSRTSGKDSGTDFHLFFRIANK